MNYTQRLRNYGSWAVVTGASDGIGRAFARQLASAGINVVLVARRESELLQTANDINAEFRVETRVVAADLTTSTGIQAVIDETDDCDVGLFVGAAGFGTSGDFVDIPIADEVNMIDLNCRALIIHTHHFARRFVERGAGGIFLLSSIVAFQGVPRSANYAATKAYVQSLAEGLRIELANHNVDVLAVAPGPVASGFADRAGMQMGGADTPKSVAAGAVRALGKRLTVRTGLLGKILGYSLCLLPRWGRIQVLKLVMAGMTRQQRSG